MEYPSSMLEAAILTVSSPKLLPTLQPTHWGAEWKKEKLDSAHALFSNSQNTGVLPTLF